MVIHSVVELFIIFATYSVIHAFIYRAKGRRECEWLLMWS